MTHDYQETVRGKMVHMARVWLREAAQKRNIAKAYAARDLFASFAMGEELNAAEELIDELQPVAAEKGAEEA